MARFGKFGSQLIIAAILLLCGRPAQPAESDADELRALQRSAVRHAHLDESSRQSLEARLHLAPLLPNLRLSVGRGWQWAYSTQTDGTPSQTLDGDRTSYLVGAQWDLGRLLFAREELGLSLNAQRVAGLRTQLQLRVARVYGLRCRAESERQRASSAEADAQLAGRIGALDVALAALTGDEAAVRRLHGCKSPLSSSLATELDALEPRPSPSSTPPPLHSPMHSLAPPPASTLDDEDEALY